MLKWDPNRNPRIMGIVFFLPFALRQSGATHEATHEVTHEATLIRRVVRHS